MYTVLQRLASSPPLQGMSRQLYRSFAAAAAAEAYFAQASTQRIKQLINGEFVESSSEESIDVVNPVSTQCVNLNRLSE